MKQPVVLSGVFGVLGTLVGTSVVTGVLLWLESSPAVAAAAGAIAGGWAGACAVVVAILVLPAPPPPRSNVPAGLLESLERLDEPGALPELVDPSPELLSAIRACAAVVRERRRRIEEQLTERTEALTRERQLVRKLREQMRQSLSVQDAFLSRMSHELRTPLNAIVGYTEMLIEEGEPRWADDLGRVRLASMNLAALVTSVLDLTELQTASFAVRPEPLVLERLVRQVVDSVRFIADTNGTVLELDVEVDLVPTLDRRMLVSILYNLVSNAAKYTVGGKVRVTAHRLPRAEPDGRDAVEIVISDTGIGMTPRQIEEAFRPFSQGDETSTRRYDGSGVGLAVVRGFVDAMAGKVELHSVPGQGARVTVRLPFEVQRRAGRGIGEEEPTVFVR